MLLAWAYRLAPTGTASQKDPDQKPRPGTLLLAHGGRLQSWDDEVRRIANKVGASIPTEIAFGRATKRTIQEGIDRLTARDVTEIIAIPLFVSSRSSAITSAEYLLGLRAEAPEDMRILADEMKRSLQYAEIRYLSVRDDVLAMRSERQLRSNYAGKWKKYMTPFTLR